MTEQVAAFQKIWMETVSKLLQTATNLPPDSAPPDVLRQMRGGVFQGLAKSWDEFLRSPQFLEGMKQWIDTTILVRRMSNDLLTRSRHEMQATAREDTDSVMLAMRHLESRLLDRMEQLEAKVSGSSPRPAGARANGSRPARAARTAARKPSNRKSLRSKQTPAG